MVSHPRDRWNPFPAFGSITKKRGLPGGWKSRKVTAGLNDADHHDIADYPTAGSGRHDG
jgi:hypothetical protein